MTAGMSGNRRVLEAEDVLQYVLGGDDLVLEVFGSCARARSYYACVYGTFMSSLIRKEVDYLHGN